MSVAVDPTEQVDLLLRDLRTAPSGLSSREAERRLAAVRAERARPPGRAPLAAGARAQFTHPLALLLWVAAALALVGRASCRSPSRSSR